MKALVYQGSKKLELLERPIPKPGKKEVLVRVKACGICGSDIHGYLGITGRRLGGVAMGHEFSGIIEELGQDVERHSVGERVIVQPIDSCGNCQYCEQGNNNLCYSRKLMGVLDVQGAMAEYIVVPEKLLIPMPTNCSYEKGALSEPFAVAYAAVNKVESYENKTVLIIGAGTIGLCILKILKLRNPKKIIMSDLSNARLKHAREMGADEVVNPSADNFTERLYEITKGELCDITIEAVGVNSSVQQSIQALKKNGVTIWTGVSQHDVTIDMHEIVTFQRSIIGSMNYTHKEFEETVELLASERFETEELVSARVSLDEAEDMFMKIHQNPDEWIKVIIVI